MHRSDEDDDDDDVVNKPSNPRPSPATVKKEERGNKVYGYQERKKKKAQTSDPSSMCLTSPILAIGRAMKSVKQGSPAKEPSKVSEGSRQRKYPELFMERHQRRDLPVGSTRGQEMRGITVEDGIDAGPAKGSSEHEYVVPWRKDGDEIGGGNEGILVSPFPTRIARATERKARPGQG